MENKSVRRIDLFNLLQYVVKKWMIVVLVAVLSAGLTGGYFFFMYKVQQKNLEFYNANKVDLVYGSFVVYVTNFDDSDYFANRIDDVTSMIKGYTCLNGLAEAEGINANYYQMINSVSVISTGINGLEISLEGSLIGLDQERVLKATETLKKIVMEEFEKNFGKGTLVLVDDVHPNAYVLEKAAGSDENQEKKITKKSVIKNGILGGIIGGVLGVVAVIFYTLISTVLRGRTDVLECYGINVLGELSVKKDNQEEYKRIARRISSYARIAVTSISDEKQREAVATNLAGKLAVNGKKALVIKIAQESDSVEKNPLYQYITGKISAKDLVEECDKAVSVARWSQASTEGIDLFTHEGFKHALEELSGAYDYVMIDCPSAKTCAAAVCVAALCDLTVVVAGDGKDKEYDVVKYKHELAENQITELGLVYVG